MLIGRYFLFEKKMCMITEYNKNAAHECESYNGICVIAHDDNIQPEFYSFIYL